MTDTPDQTWLRLRSWAASCCVALGSLLTLAAAAPGAELPDSYDVLDLPLERLVDVPVVSAARKTQSLSEVASAVFVINAEDIRRSGATSIPDLLRMVPGMQVARVDGTTWSVSARGFNGVFANKLLVMIDGRSVYTPLYGGVFWDVQDTLLENIERIEVIRGSGSTMWGANAVNGVINIITKNAQDTQGGLVSILSGDRERFTVGTRYGAGIGSVTEYRLYLKHVERAGSPSTLLASSDTLSVTRGGFRVDSTPREGLNLTLQGDAYGGGSDHGYSLPVLGPPFQTTTSYVSEVFGANLLGRADWLQSLDSKVSFQLYYDRTQRDIPLVLETRDTLDLDLQHNIRLGVRHELTWGAGYRLQHDLTRGTTFFKLDPERRNLNLVNLFVQDEIALVPGHLRLILGSKVEHNDFTGWELQPSAKLSWTPTPEYSAWASVSRSVRTPTRGESEVRVGIAAFPPVPPATQPALVALVGNPELLSESLLAYEAGVRADVGKALSLDLSAFFNQYHRIVGTQVGPPFQDGGLTVVPNYFTNLGGVQSTGAELSLQWQPLEWWKLKGGYGFIRFFGDRLEEIEGTRATPEHQATLRSLMTLGKSVELDLWGRYVGRIYQNRMATLTRIPAYLTLDARLAWRARPGLELALIGQNLLEEQHLEGISDQSQARHEVPRTVYGKVTWEF